MSIKLSANGHTINALQREGESGTYHLATARAFSGSNEERSDLCQSGRLLEPK